MNFNNKTVYQIYPKSFKDTNDDGIGDLNGIIEKLDYLQNLGVDYIWLSPINKSPQYDNGYDISDYYSIDPMFGTLQEYELLIAEAKKRNMSIMLDLVLNHTSSEHEWFKKAIAGEEEYIDYYIWTEEPNDLMGFFSKSAWTYNDERKMYYLSLFDEHQPDLNWDNPKVRSEIYKMVNYWIDLGVEGFRLDVIDLIGKEPFNKITGKGPNFLKYLKELQNNTFGTKLLTVGECWNSTLEEAAAMCSDDGLSEIFHFSNVILTNSPEDKFIQKTIDFEEYRKVLVKWNNEYKGNQAVVMNNHDLPRMISLWMDDEEYRYESATNLATLSMFMRGTQYIYQGEEIGMTNLYESNIKTYDDVETKNYYNKHLENVPEKQLMERIMKVSRDNARSVMQWNNEKYAGFSKVKPWIHVNANKDYVNVEEDLVSPKSVYQYYRQLIRIRKEDYDYYIDSNIEKSTYINEILYIEKENVIIVANMKANKKEYDFNGENIIITNCELSPNILNPFQVIVFKK